MTTALIAPPEPVEFHGGKPMRVLQVHNFYQQAGGEDVIFHSEGDVLRDAGFVVDSYTVSNDDIRTPLDSLTAAASLTWSRKQYQQIRQKIATFSPDLVHVHNFFPLITPSVFDACADSRVPVVMSLHNYRLTCAAYALFRQGKVCELCITGSPFNAVRYACYRGSWIGSFAVARMISYHRRNGTWRSKVDRYIVHTDFQKEKMRDAGLPEHKLRIKPNFTEDPVTRGIEIDGSRQGAIFVGRLSSEKGVDLLIDAWQDIDVPLTVLGTGPLEDELRSRANSNVVFLGRQPRDVIFKYMARSSFITVTSAWYEVFPMVVVEALASGLPVLAPHLGNFPFIVRDGKTGWLYREHTVTSVRACIRLAIEQTGKSNCFSIEARQDYLENYTPARVGDRLQQIYRELVESYS